ncbi:10 kDa chaperonin, mitochondrial-like isoform X1 [Cucumis melo]|uniref:10 kDa chaperonin, mitochondrial-like isoform X1 n=1 Tax=Cucumis melo TaxID=3656 RepID=A0ABM3L6L7_CUCME|nr:10 kDa chaperonin, mitochondrial-like isoform X1 [Cucumis melo]
MAKRLIPSLNRVLIEKIVPPSKTSAGILLPESSSKLNSGKVIAVGPGARDINGNLVPVCVKEGDTVLLPEYGGTSVKLGEKEYASTFLALFVEMMVFDLNLPAYAYCICLLSSLSLSQIEQFYNFRTRLEYSGLCVSLRYQSY